MALLIVAVPVVQDLISVHWSDGIKTALMVPAGALYGQCSIEEGGKLLAF